ncbi:MAG TPA: SCO family protein [Candidatus Baltobacteraceae bacterium]|nr:SCO family protein [Candidatus Baltobacteraceae bacterium]
MIRILVLLAMLAQTATSQPQLIDQNGHAFTLGSLHGRPVVITFVSAHCTDACPLVNAQFAQAAQTIAQRKIDATLLTITLDPQHDSLADMRKIAREFSADSHHWLVAGGTTRDVENVMHGFGVMAVIGKSGYREAHTTFVYVLDANGRLAKTMLASTGLADDVVAAVAPPKVAAR